jgi:pimeloyl-ACP methyl ester carboxylesterase
VEWLNGEEMAEEMWFESGGTRLFAVRGGGGGPAVVLCHGGLATHAACRAFAAQLEARFRVVTPDLRGLVLLHPAYGRFLPSGAQPFAHAAELAAIRVSMLLVPGIFADGLGAGQADRKNVGTFEARFGG